MKRVRSKDTRPEMSLRRRLWSEGFRYRKHVEELPGKPDVVFVRQRLAIFVDGCFWHGCPVHYARPKTAFDYWEAKLAGNVERDSRRTLDLERGGWRVVRFWEHEIVRDLPGVMERIRSALGGTSEPDQWRVVGVRPEQDGRERRTLRMLRNSEIVRVDVVPRRHKHI